MAVPAGAGVSVVTSTGNGVGMGKAAATIIVADGVGVTGGNRLTRLDGADARVDWRPQVEPQRRIDRDAPARAVRYGWQVRLAGL